MNKYFGAFVHRRNGSSEWSASLNPSAIHGPATVSLHLGGITAVNDAITDDGKRVYVTPYHRLRTTPMDIFTYKSGDDRIYGKLEILPDDIRFHRTDDFVAVRRPQPAGLEQALRNSSELMTHITDDAFDARALAKLLEENDWVSRDGEIWSCWPHGLDVVICLRGKNELRQDIGLRRPKVRMDTNPFYPPLRALFIRIIKELGWSIIRAKKRSFEENRRNFANHTESSDIHEVTFASPEIQTDQDFDGAMVAHGRYYRWEGRSPYYHNHGASMMMFWDGHLSYIHNCRRPDGSRVTVDPAFASHSTETLSELFRMKENDAFVYGMIRVLEDGIEFIPDYNFCASRNPNKTGLEADIFVSSGFRSFVKLGPWQPSILAMILDRHPWTHQAGGKWYSEQRGYQIVAELRAKNELVKDIKGGLSGPYEMIRCLKDSDGKSIADEIYRMIQEIGWTGPGAPKQ